MQTNVDENGEKQLYAVIVEVFWAWCSLCQKTPVVLFCFFWEKAHQSESRKFWCSWKKRFPVFFSENVQSFKSLGAWQKIRSEELLGIFCYAIQSVIFLMAKWCCSHHERILEISEKWISDEAKNAFFVVRKKIEWGFGNFRLLVQAEKWHETQCDRQNSKCFFFLANSFEIFRLQKCRLLYCGHEITIF